MSFRVSQSHNKAYHAFQKQHFWCRTNGVDTSMPVYQGETQDNDHEKYPTDETAEHVHYNGNDEVAILTLKDDGSGSDDGYNGEPYECPFCSATVDYDSDGGDVDEGELEENTEDPEVEDSGSDTQDEYEDESGDGGNDEDEEEALF